MRILISDSIEDCSLTVASLRGKRETAEDWLVARGQEASACWGQKAGQSFGE